MNIILMKKFAATLSLVALFIINFSHAQEIELTLNDAVLKQYSELYPERVSGLMWLSDDIYLRNEGSGEESKIVSTDIKKDEESDFLTLKEFKEMMQRLHSHEVKSLPRFNVINPSNLIFQSDGTYYSYNPKKKSAESFENEKEGISDASFNGDGTLLAYVKENNIYIKGIDQEVIQVTEDGNDDIVYGKSVSRQEFGISKGLFWSTDNMRLAYYRNDHQSTLFS